jgi:hypothetical protein
MPVLCQPHKPVAPPPPPHPPEWGIRIRSNGYWLCLCVVVSLICPFAEMHVGQTEFVCRVESNLLAFRISSYVDWCSRVLDPAPRTLRSKPSLRLLKPRNYERTVSRINVIIRHPGTFGNRRSNTGRRGPKTEGCPAPPDPGSWTTLKLIEG